MKVRVDDEAKRLARGGFRQLFHRGQHLIGHLCCSGVDHQNAVISHLDGNISSRADEHGYVSLHRQHIDLSILILLRRGADGHHQHQKT
jgi:hypothetical protein